MCDKKFIDLGNLQQHRKLHDSETPLPCPKCEKFFAQPNYLKNHFETAHATVKPFQCQSCEKRFAMFRMLNKHMKSHLGERMKKKEKTFKCESCIKSFSLRINLIKHRFIHKWQAKCICGDNFHYYLLFPKKLRPSEWTELTDCFVSRVELFHPYFHPVSHLVRNNTKICWGKWLNIFWTNNVCFKNNTNLLNKCRFFGPIVGCFTSGSTSLNTVSWSSLKWIETTDIEYRISSSQRIETFRLLQAQNNCMCCIKIPLKPVCPKFKTHRHLKRLPFRF